MANLYISAAHKSSGKTSISIGLLAAFAERGIAIQPFKKGPDYIDPMWLARAGGRACYNLDYNTQTHDEILALFGRQGDGANFSLIEGNKGLYDGLDPEGSDCNAALAKLLRMPVILVLDAEGVTRGLAPLVMGYQAFDEDVSIEGIILNRVASPRHEAKLRASLENYTDVPLLGAIGRHEALTVSERHLGLTTPCELGAVKSKIACLKMAVREGVDLDAVLDISGGSRVPGKTEPRTTARPVADIRLGVARDAAFNFYYQDDLEELERAGTELVFFDTLSAERLPQVDGLFLGGGFPETQMAALEANAGLRADIFNAAESGLPVYAECGGLMYLCRTIAWRGKCREMVGAIPYDAVMHAKPQGRGLVRLEETGNARWQSNAQETFRAHEFHYAALTNGPDDAVFAYRVLRGRGIDGEHDGIVMGNLQANFCHLRDTGQNNWASRFVAFVRSCKKSPAKPRQPMAESLHG